MERLPQYGPSPRESITRVWRTARPDGFWSAVLETAAYVRGDVVANQFVHTISGIMEVEPHPTRPLTGKGYVQINSFNPV